MTRVCNEDCNHCPVILHPNSKMLTKILNQIYDKFGEEVYPIVEDNCPNFTVCYDCRIDDFCHMEDCELVDSEQELTRKERKAKLEKIKKEAKEKELYEIHKQLRTHGIFISVGPFKEQWDYEIINLNVPIDINKRVEKIVDNIFKQLYYDSYENALEAGIEEVLNTNIKLARKLKLNKIN